MSSAVFHFLPRHIARDLDWKLGFKLASIWNASASDKDLTYWATTMAPECSFFGWREHNVAVLGQIIFIRRLLIMSLKIWISTVNLSSHQWDTWSWELESFHGNKPKEHDKNDGSSDWNYEKIIQQGRHVSERCRMSESILISKPFPKLIFLCVLLPWRRCKKFIWFHPESSAVGLDLFSCLY